MAAKRKRKTKAEIAAQLQAAAEARVVLWAETHGAPVKLLVGWDPDRGTWAVGSPVAQMLGLIQGANFPTTAARLAGISNLSSLIAKGNEYMQDQPEDRAFIPIDVLPFIDLVRELDKAESVCEVDVVKTAVRGAKQDPKLALAFLARRFGSRWREQQTIFTAEGADERDAAISEAIQDPNVAAALAQIGHRVEDATPREA